MPLCSMIVGEFYAPKGLDFLLCEFKMPDLKAWAIIAVMGILGAGEMQTRGHGLDGIDGFDGLGNADAGTVNTPFDAMQAKSDEFYPVNPNSAQRIQTEQRRAPSELISDDPLGCIDNGVTGKPGFIHGLTQVRRGLRRLLDGVALHGPLITIA